MTTSRRQSVGRSPLVRKQSQITTFFSPGKTPSPNPNPNPSEDKQKKTLLIPSPDSDRKTPPITGKKKKPILFPSSDPNHKTPPTTAKKPQSEGSVRKKKPLPVPSPDSERRTPPAAGRKPRSEDAVGKRVRVFWPLDKAWYEGVVKSFDVSSGKHMVQYDDAEEEFLDLGSEKVEWVEEEAPRSLRRLRRLSSSSAASMECDKEVEEESAGDDSSEDEDWGKGMGKGLDDDDSEEDAELEVEEEEEPATKKSRSGRGTSSSVGLGKRKKIEVDKLGCSKKFRFDGDGDGEKSASVTPMSKSRFFTTDNTYRAQDVDISVSKLAGDVAERFGKRDADKFKFLGVARKDAHGRRPRDEGYDPKTVYLPREFLKSLSGGQRQWWEFKSKHMDKVLFFKMGKFYELFEMDAHVGAKELDLQYMKGEQPHCGFPEKNFSMNLEKLARKGYRVLVIEQTETPEQLELRRKEMGAKDKVVNREICAMVTKGTLTEGELLLTNPDASYLMSITEKCQVENQNKEATVIGVCVVDVSTSKFMVGQFEDDQDRHCLCSILSELRPVEIVKPLNVLSPETEKVLKSHTRNPLVNVLLPSLEFWDAEKTICEIRNIYAVSKHSLESELINVANGAISANSDNVENMELLPDVIFNLLSAGKDGSFALSALGGCLYYLKQAFLDEALLKCAKFELLSCTGFQNALQKPYMILDSAALENLEILENTNGGPSGTLFAHLDHCVTSFGKRLLKSWLVRPLYDTGLIVERQDAIAGFKGEGLTSALQFRKEMLRLPDMERLLARLFASCEANGRNANRVVLYEDAAKKQLQEFIAALRGCQVMVHACSSLNSFLPSTKSSLLHHLLTPGKGLPDTCSILKHFKDAFDWSEAYHSGRIEPREGADHEYDIASTTSNEIESSLMMYLKEQKKILGDSSITYVTIGKESYLLEVPDDLSATVPQEYELRSSKKGYFRYWTPKIKTYLSELSQAEADKESKLKSILQRLIGQFAEHHSKWRQLVSVIAELDVLISLAIASDYYDGPTCRPIIKETRNSNDDSPYLSAKSLGHPVLRSDALGKGSFVPNDVNIGGVGIASFILLTGPNMGGKSTLIRQVCMAVILAQLGADVPAERFELSCVDRIFVRMGARDHIMSGQSTFLMELSETASMLSSATQNSLVALDELGRGTSTSDGQAIAASVLDYLVREVKCRGLFSTHYHRLAVEFEKHTKVSQYHMACQVGTGVGGVEEVTFLYKLTPGSCPKSYGVNVARLAGIPPSVLEKAMAKSTEFEMNYGKHGTKCDIPSSTREAVVVIQDMLRLMEAWDQQENPQAVSMQLLIGIQQKARLLVLGN